MVTQKNQINLLPEEELQKTTSGKIVLWMLTTFRTIVIITELLVMSAFLSRFWLDAQNAELTEKINENKDIIIGFQKFESDFRETQKKLAYFRDLTTKNTLANTLINYSVVALPEDSVLNSIAFDGTKVEISGSTPSEKSVQQYISNLSVQEKLSEISLIDMRTNQFNPGVLDFRILATGKITN